MRKSDLIDAVAQASDLTKAQATQVVNAVLDEILLALSNGEPVSLPGFGSFERRHRAARTGRNPQTGAEIQIAASKAPAFKAGSKLKQRVSS